MSFAGKENLLTCFNLFVFRGVRLPVLWDTVHLSQIAQIAQVSLPIETRHATK